MPLPAKDPVTGKFLPKSATATDPTPVVLPGDEPKSIEPAPDDKTNQPEGDKQTDLSGAQALVDSWLGDKPTKVEKKPEKKPDPEKKPAAKVPPKAAPKADKPLTAADIAAAAAEGVARAIPRPEKKSDTKEPPPGNVDAFLNDKDKRRINVLSKLEELYPDRYKGVAAKYRDSKRKLVEYSEDWKKAHPGQEFDEAASEHEEFFETNDVDWDDDEYLEAVADLRAEAKVSKTEQETSRKLSDIERREKLRESAHLIGREQNNLAKQYWKLLGDDFADVIDDHGMVNVTKLKEMQEKDPVPYEVRVKFAEQLDAEVAELCKLLGVPGETGPLADYNEKNPIHSTLSNFALAQEDALMGAPAEDRLNSKGQTFLRATDYWKLTPAERARYWTFSATDLSVLRAKNLTDEAQKIIAAEESKFRNWAKARGIKLEDKPQKQDGEEEAELEEQSAGDDTKPISPAAGGESKLAAAKSKAAEQVASGASAFVSRAF